MAPCFRAPGRIAGMAVLHAHLASGDRARNEVMGPHSCTADRDRARRKRFPCLAQCPERGAEVGVDVAVAYLPGENRRIVSVAYAHVALDFLFEGFLVRGCRSAPQSFAVPAWLHQHDALVVATLYKPGAAR